MDAWDVGRCEGGAPFEGEHYRLERPLGHPAPLQRPHPPVLIGPGAKDSLGGRDVAAGGDDPGPRVEPDALAGFMSGERGAQPHQRLLGGGRVPLGE